jgi:tetratricopeptide (TPR) repeat protein
MTATSPPAIHRYRHEESENHCHRGVECLLLAEEEGFQNRELLTEASDAFLSAIQHYRQNTQAYVGIAYLLWRLGDNTRALQYLEEGLRSQPSDPDVHALIRSITGYSTASPSSSAASPPSINVTAASTGAPPPSSPVTETRIVEIQQKVARTKQKIEAENTRLIRPSINLHEIDLLQDQLSQWEATYYDILEDIDTLDTFHVRVMLTCELSVLQDRILDYHSALQCSEELIALDDKIQAVSRSVKQTQEELESGKPGMYDALLESYYEQCDALADALDDLESKNIPVRVLDSHYQQLVDRVESLALEQGEEDA